MELSIQDVESIDIPRYSSRFEVLCNPKEEMVVGEGEVWLRARAKESGFEDIEDDVEKLIVSNVGHVSCRFWPHCSNSKLALTLLKLMYWLFIFDEVMDNPSLLGWDTLASQQFCGFILQTFFSLDSAEAVGNLHLLPTLASGSLLMPTLALTLLVEWWAELRAGMSARQQARFCSHFADYVLANARQARLREEKEVPKLEEYMRIRTLAGAMNVVEMVAEQACEIELDEEELRNPRVKRLSEAIALHASLLNDYVGFAKEYEVGEYLNMVTVLHYHNNAMISKDEQNIAPVPFHKACAEAWSIVTRIEEECVASAKAVEEWAHMHSKPGLLKYAASLCSISASNWLFALNSCRYTDCNIQQCAIELLPLEAQKDHPESSTMPITGIFLKHIANGHEA